MQSQELSPDAVVGPLAVSGGLPHEPTMMSDPRQSPLAGAMPTASTDPIPPQPPPAGESPGTGPAMLEEIAVQKHFLPPSGLSRPCLRILSVGQW